jgi:ATP phosphoribosyltransferase regulatory subunit
LLAVYPEGAAAELVEALHVKDARRVAALADVGSVPEAVRLAVAQLPTLHGGMEVLDSARPLLAGTPAAPALEALSALAHRSQAAGLSGVLQVDLGEVRGFAYYTGMTFRLLAEGPGEAIGGGGRYDDLLARFGAPMPAAGFAIDLDHLAWARGVAGATDAPRVRVAVVDGERASEVAAALRALDVVAGVIPDADALGYARSFRYSAVLREAEPGWRVVDVASGLEEARLAGPAGEVAAWVAGVARFAK